MKRFRSGTHRAVSPDTTLRRALPLAAAAGVTRIADVTGLDRLEVPTFQAVRPMARSISVAMGKGSSGSAAKVSAVMEAIETHHVEALAIAEEHAPAAALDPAIGRLWARLLPVRGGPAFDGHASRDWIGALDLRTGARALAPLGLVRFDLTRPREADILSRTNGLASGNTLAEARVAALTEVIERDAEAAWYMATPARRATARLDIERDLPAVPAALIERFRARACEPLVWDASERHGVPVYLCFLIDRRGAAHGGLSPAFGAGCHPDAEVALLRALTEAAQSRVMLVSGMREDIASELYVDPDARTRELELSALTMLAPARRWGEGGGVDLASSEDDLAWLIARLPAEEPVVCVDLTHPDFGLPVVKIIVPGFHDYNTIRRAQ